MIPDCNKVKSRECLQVWTTSLIPTEFLLPLRADIMFHPNYRLSLRRPIWWSQPAEDMTVLLAWCAEWSAIDVVNHSLVAVPSVWPPGHELPQREWVLLNRFRTGQGRQNGSLEAVLGSTLQLRRNSDDVSHSRWLHRNSISRRAARLAVGWRGCCPVD